MKKIIITAGLVVCLILTVRAKVRVVREIVSGKTGDNFGSNLAACDINNDGMEDLLVGAPGKKISENYNGQVRIYFGTGGVTNNKPDAVFKGEAPGDRFGISVTSLGDINGDGYDDFAVGADKYDASDKTDAGRVYIYLGGDPLEKKPAHKLTGKRSNNWFGSSLDGGADVNGDDRPDLLVGESYGGSKYTGAVHLFLGKENLTDWGEADLVLEGEESGDSFGNMVSFVGDINDDGYADFIVGSYYASTDNYDDAGKAYLYKGGSIVQSDPWVTFEGEKDDSWFGFSGGATGDVNNDDYPDLIIGAPKSGPKAEGKAFLYKGGPQVRANPLETFRGNNPEDLYGYAVGGNMDANSDNIPEVLIGAPYDDTGVNRGGLLEIFYGGKEISATSNMNIPGSPEDAQCGYSFCVVDNFFGDGNKVLVVSKPLSILTDKHSRVTLYRIQ